METKYITCISYHGTGSGAVDDFFREFDNFASAQSEVECRYLQDPDGISDLEYNIIENPHRLNSGFALKRYLIFAKKMEYTYRKIFGKKWMEYSKEYIDSIAKFSYKGYWHGDLRIISSVKLGIYYFRRAWSKIVPKKYKKETWYNYFPNMESYHSFISEEEFLENTKKYTTKLCGLLNNENKEFLMLDQFVPTMNIKRYMRYMDNLKVIIVDRDPRDTYLNMMRLGDHVLPKDPHQFCTVYRDIRRTLDEETKNENVIYVRFEDLIYKYDETAKRLIDFVGIKEENHVRPKSVFKPEVSKNNTQQWKNYPQLENEMKIIEEKCKEYLYTFDK